MRYTGTLRGTSLQWHNKSILSFSNSNSNSIKDNKPPKGSSRVAVCLGQVSAAQRAVQSSVALQTLSLLGCRSLLYTGGSQFEDPLFILAGPSEDPLFILVGPSLQIPFGPLATRICPLDT